MRELRFGDVTVTLANRVPDALPAIVARLAGVETVAVRVRHRCALCGGDDHGQPLVTIDGAASVPISRSRCGDWEAVAVARSGLVGVDIESIGRVGAHPVEDVLLHPAEARALAEVAGADRDRRLAELWVAKEALLKATGHGLSIDLRAIRLENVENGAGSLEPAEAPDAVGRAVLDAFVVDDDVIGAVATIAAI
jgi:4'-phosphopantetheinyl transferase